MSSTLTATRQWDITEDLPSCQGNKGAEGITYVPDSFLESKDFYDENLNVKYNSNNYKDHYNGVFFIGLEGNGYIYGYVLEKNGYTRIASFSSGEKTIMSVSFDTTTGSIWSLCDDNCDGRMGVFQIKDGSWVKRKTYERPTSMGNYNNEGLAISTICNSDGYKSVYFADDDNDNSHAIRTDLIPCDV